jgi:hypothetical protein
MLCHVCEDDAVGRCKSCGLAFCGGHGFDYCRQCVVAITPTKPGSPAFRTIGYLQCVGKPRMKTVYLDDDGPPACYACGGFAKHICLHCQNLYCPDHAGKSTWCESCTRTASANLRLALIVLAAMTALFAGLSWWHALIRF